MAEKTTLKNYTTESYNVLAKNMVDQLAQGSRKLETTTLNFIWRWLLCVKEPGLEFRQLC
ncbi:MAG: hypothetical protein R6V77_01980 [Candidatus Cloacimonadaceae bacterium]